MLEPFNVDLNAAIMELAALMLPDGFDVAADAPQTFESLKAHLDARRRLVVWSGGSQATIYGELRVNYAFRAWHDWCHWQGNHDFSLEGEIATCEMQCRQLKQRFDDAENVNRWCDIIRAEIVGQGQFYQRHKRFPDDQRGFVLEYLRDPVAAIAWPLW
jgi:hypothetical protein